MSLVSGCNVEFDAETSRFKKQEEDVKRIRARALVIT